MSDQGLGWAKPATTRRRALPLVRNSRMVILWGNRVNNEHMLSIVRPVLALRDWELVAMRASWNVGGWEEWIAHLASNRPLRGRTWVERVKLGPLAAGWAEREAMLLTAVDELHDDLAVSDATWERLGAYLDDRQRIELCFITGMYELIGVLLRSIGTPALPTRIAERSAGRSPAPRRPRRPGAESERHRPPADATLPESSWAGAVEVSQVWPFADDTVADLLAARYRKAARLLTDVTRRTARHGTLAPADRELAALRLAWRCGPAVEWRHHLGLGAQLGFGADLVERIKTGPTADGLTERQAAVLQAVDEIDGEYFVSDGTWARLERHLDLAQLVELCFFVAHSRMTAMGVNSLNPGGVPRLGRSEVGGDGSVVLGAEGLG